MENGEMTEKNLPETDITRMKIEKILKYKGELRQQKKDSIAYTIFMGFHLLLTFANAKNALDYFKGNENKLYYVITTVIFCLLTGVYINDFSSLLAKKTILEDKITSLQEELGMENEKNKVKTK